MSTVAAAARIGRARAERGQAALLGGQLVVAHALAELAVGVQDLGGPRPRG
ncbi:MAG: hypothetical protein HS111_01050 [Kofleriaceae bacterium]|nr:hypothetical protein [Kofleriaceae bacterium]